MCQVCCLCMVTTLCSCSCIVLVRPFGSGRVWNSVPGHVDMVRGLFGDPTFLSSKVGMSLFRPCFRSRCSDVDIRPVQPKVTQTLFHRLLTGSRKVVVNRLRIARTGIVVMLLLSRQNLPRRLNQLIRRTSLLTSPIWQDAHHKPLRGRPAFCYSRYGILLLSQTIRRFHFVLINGLH
jgi:hypothetical protein